MSSVPYFDAEKSVKFEVNTGTVWHRRKEHARRHATYLSSTYHQMHLERMQSDDTALRQLPKEPTSIEANSVYTVSIFADMVKVKRQDAPAPEHGIFERGEIKGFSERSRKRMIESLAAIERVPDLFATMTYSDDVVSMNPEVFRPQFEAFRRRLERAYPDITAMWRIEIVPRKSGKLKGQDQPHLHMLVWLPVAMSQEQKDEILEGKGKEWRKWWHEIIGSNNAYHLETYGLQLEPIRSRRHAYHYASKYVGKTANDEYAIGRRWGRIGQLDTLPVLEIDISRSEYIQLKRAIAAYAAKRKQWVGKMVKRLNPNKGLTAFGLGAWNDVNKGLESSTIMKLLIHVLGANVVKYHILTDDTNVRD